MMTTIAPDVDTQSADTDIHLVTEQELPQYEEYVISKFNLRSHTFSNIVLLKMKNKMDADIWTDEWPEFKCTVVKLPVSKATTMVFFLSNSQESLEKLLFISECQEISLFFQFDLQTYDHFKSVTSWPSGFTDNIISTYKYFHFPGTIDDLPSWSCPQGTFTARLNSEHASFISEIWDLFKPQCRREYLKSIIAKSFSVGLFLETDPSQPVSWAFVSNFGQINGVHTMEKHRRKGYSRVTVLCLMKQMLEADMVPAFGVYLHNTPSIKLCTGLGFVEAFHVTYNYLVI